MIPSIKVLPLLSPKEINMAVKLKTATTEESPKAGHVPPWVDTKHNQLPRSGSPTRFSFLPELLSTGSGPYSSASASSPLHSPSRHSGSPPQPSSTWSPKLSPTSPTKSASPGTSPPSSPGSHPVSPLPGSSSPGGGPASPFRTSSPVSTSPSHSLSPRKVQSSDSCSPKTILIISVAVGVLACLVGLYLKNRV